MSQTTLKPGLLCPPPLVFSVFLWFFDVLVEITTKPLHPGCGLRSNCNVGPAGMPRAAAKAVRFVWVPVAGRDGAKTSPGTGITTGTWFCGQCSRPLDRFEHRIVPRAARAAAHSVVIWHVSAHHFDIWSSPNRLIFWQKGSDWSKNIGFQPPLQRGLVATSGWLEINAWGSWGTHLHLIANVAAPGARRLTFGGAVFLPDFHVFILLNTIEGRP